MNFSFFYSKSVLAYSISVSLPLKKSLNCKPICVSGIIPNSVVRLSLSNTGQAEKRILQPFGSSLLKGSPEPPPVLSPITCTLGQHFIHFTNSFAALYTPRLVRIRPAFANVCPDWALTIVLEVQKSHHAYDPFYAAYSPQAAAHW